MLKQTKKKYPKAKFTKHAYDKHRRLLAELPEKGGSKATEHIQPQPDVGVDPGLQFEPGKQRVASHISDFAAPLQKAMAQHHMGDLDKRIHRLASTGLPH